MAGWGKGRAEARVGEEGGGRKEREAEGDEWKRGEQRPCREGEKGRGKRKNRERWRKKPWDVSMVQTMSNEELLTSIHLASAISLGLMVMSVLSGRRRQAK